MRRTSCSKLKVLLVQVPHPAILDRNVPLAAGYLKAWAWRRGLTDEVEIEIGAPPVVDRSGCRRLVDWVVERRPDLLGVSLYLWNVERTLYIVEEVRRRLPRLRVVAGGPEATRRNALLERSSLDFLVIGEGEETFVELLRHLLAGDPSLPGIDGLGYWRDGGRAFNRPRAPLPSLDLLPSPYLLGLVDPAAFREMLVFTMRGCVQGCSYCAWTSRGRPRPLPLEQLREELRLARKLRRETIVSIADSAFNASPHFAEACALLGALNHDRRMRLNGFVQAELVDHETARALRGAGFSGVEVGLQSASPEVLLAVDRRVDLERFLEGVGILRGHGLSVVVDVILGLPGDTSAGFARTVKLLRDRHLEPTMFTLSVGSGSRLHASKERHGLEVQPAAPWYVRSTASLSRDELGRVFREHVLCSGDLDRMIDLRYPTIATRDPARVRAEPIDVAGLAQGERPVSHLVVRLDGAPRVRDPRALAEALARQASSRLSVLCLAGGEPATAELEAVTLILSRVSQANPHVTWDLLVEGGPELPRRILAELTRCLERPRTFLDRRDELFPRDLGIVRRQAVNVLALVPWTPNDARPAVDGWRWLRTISLGPTHPARDVVARLLDSRGCGLLVDFERSTRLDAVEGAMRLLREENRGGKAVFFRDWVLQRLWEQAHLAVTPERQLRREVLVAEDGAVFVADRDEADLLWDASARWSLVRPEAAGKDLEQLVLAAAVARLSDRSRSGRGA
jgi:hypothetical protein